MGGSRDVSATLVSSQSVCDACAALASSIWSDVGVRSCEVVSVDALSLSCCLGGHRFAAHVVDVLRYGFEVIWSHAVADSA